MGIKKKSFKLKTVEYRLRRISSKQMRYFMLIICINCFTQYAPQGHGYDQTCPNCSCKYFYTDPFDGALAPLYISLHKKGYCLEDIAIVVDRKGVYYFQVFFQTWIQRKKLKPLPKGFFISRYKHKSYDGPRMIKRFNTTDLQKCEDQVSDISQNLLLWSQGLPQLYKFRALFETNSLHTAHKLRNILRRKYKFCDVATSGNINSPKVIATTAVYVKDDPVLIQEMEKLAKRNKCKFNLMQ